MINVTINKEKEKAESLSCGDMVKCTNKGGDVVYFLLVQIEDNYYIVVDITIGCKFNRYYDLKIPVSGLTTESLCKILEEDKVEIVDYDMQITIKE